MNLTRIAVTASLAVSLAIIGLRTTASAQQVTINNQYGVQIFYPDPTQVLVTGGMNSVNTNDIYTNASTPFPANLHINKELWFITDTSTGDWVETGSHLGQLGAMNTCTTPCIFEESSLDGSIQILVPSTSGAHSFSIDYQPADAGYDVSIDSFWYYTVQSGSPPVGASELQVGIENNNTMNSFNSGTYMNQLTYAYQGSPIYYWDTASNGDVNPPSWTTQTYSSIFYASGDPASPDSFTPTVVVNNS